MDFKIILKICSTRKRWIAYGKGGEDEYFVEQEAKVGPFPQKYFPLIVIKEIHKDRINKCK